MKQRKGIFMLVCSLLALIIFAGNNLQQHEDMPALLQLRSQSTALAAAEVDEATRGQVVANYGKLPMRFEANEGQFNEQVRFVTRGSGYCLFLTANEAVLSLRHEADAQVKCGKEALPKTAGTPAPQYASTVVRMKLANANPNPAVSGQTEMVTKSNYFSGSDPSQWRTNVVNYQKVHYEAIYEGIDLVYYGNQQHLEYDFVVAPGADPYKIEMQFDGLAAKEGDAPITLDERGNAILHLTGGELLLQTPFIYQENDGEREPVDGAYRLTDGYHLAFAVADYDDSRPLVIDPVLRYSTFLGGSGSEYGYGIAADANGNTYVTGTTQDATTDFPSTTGAFSTTHNGGTDIFVSKLSADGSSLLYSTFLGGTGYDGAYALAIDGNGNAYVTGSTMSSDFPTTAGAFDITHNGNADAFVSLFNPTGSALLYSTFLGGTGYDEGWGIAVDVDGNAYIAGYTYDSITDFPTTAGAFNMTHNGGGVDAFVSKLNATGTALDYSTFLGGTGGDAAYGIAVDANRSAYVVGTTDAGIDFPVTTGAYDETHNGSTDVFVSKLNPTGTALDYSTFLGGSSAEEAWGVAVDAGGNAYVTGYTGAGTTGFPTTAGAFDVTHNGGSDVFVSKLNATGAALIYSTFLGGSSQETGYAIAVDASGNAYVTGETTDAVTDFPTTTGAFDETHNGASDVFVSQLSSDGSSLLYSTFLGGSPDATSNGRDEGWGIAVDAGGNLYVTGSTAMAINGFPSTAGAYDEVHNGSRDAFVVKFSPKVLVQIDIKPGDDPNFVKCTKDNQKIPVAILTTNDFDATTVDHTTVRFGKTGTEAAEVHRVKRTGEAKRHEDDVDGDGDIDLVFHFRLGDTGIECGDEMAMLTGQTFSGQAIQGSDAIIAASHNKLIVLEDTPAIPDQYALEQNYPNPFNPTTGIRFTLPEAAAVKLTVYDISGREVRSLISGSLAEGTYDIQWDATSNNGTAVASGVYIYRLQAGSFIQTRKMTLLR